MKHLINWLTNPQPVSLMTFMSPVIIIAVMFAIGAYFKLS